ncbi:AAA family ATPase [Aneurinibacillus sp. BA2021]|nr:AAA family ATPase [Aneurinibacillus sp. BA2021]
MYISQMRVQNFRCFKEDFVVKFNPGMNVIIGANNSGKTTIIRALEMIFSRNNTKKLSIDDFNKSLKDFSEPPEILIEAKIRVEQNDSDEDKALIASWITDIGQDFWEATLTYKFFLPEGNKEKYQKEIAEVQDTNAMWRILERHLPRYVSKVYGGNPINKLKADTELLEKIHCEVLDALRDVESKMASGRSALLKQVLLHFKDVVSENTLENNQDTELKSPEEQFEEYANNIVDNLVSRIDVTDIVDLAKDTGASVGGEPKLNGFLSESDILSVLSLVIRKTSGIEVPISNNGLGYNNLIYISLILAKFKVITSVEQGENAKTFPMLLVEEPEAHLHPSLQYNFLKFLKEEIEKQQNSRQIFITTHSTQITSAVGLDAIICVEEDTSGVIKAKLPSKVFGNTTEDIKSKKYIERFLDATKSAMLFAKSVILVEGMAELLLFPAFAKQLNEDLERQHVSVVKVDSVSFKHFVKLFGSGGVCDNALDKRVSCVTDKDPLKKSKAKNQRWKKCWPFELNTNNEHFEYEPLSFALKNLKTAIDSSSNVRVFHNTEDWGKTLEFDIAWENYDKDFFRNDIELDDELMSLIEHSEEMERNLTATKYLTYADGQKGEIAFNLLEYLNSTEEPTIILPSYIEKSILWACHKEVH